MIRRSFVVSAVLVAVFALVPRAASAGASATAFVGFSPTVANRVASGVAFAGKFTFIGIEGEYSHINQNGTHHVPGVTTVMGNIVLATPGKTSVYVTGGAGFSHETLDAQGQYGVAVNVGGGVKIRLIRIVKVRIDYRVIMLHGTIADSKGKTQHRIYGGIEFGF